MLSLLFQVWPNPIVELNGFEDWNVLFVKFSNFEKLVLVLLKDVVKSKLLLLLIRSVATFLGFSYTLALSLKIGSCTCFVFLISLKKFML